MRPNGNAGGNYGVNEARVWNPADRTKTTIKEQTIENKYEAHVIYLFSQMKHGVGPTCRRQGSAD